MAHHRFSFGEYVDLVADKGIKLEFLDGQVWAMSGATVEHARVTTNISSLLSAAPRGRPCAVFSPDLRIRAKATGLASPSTEAYDRGEKLRHYQTIPALKEVVFAAHDRREIEVVRREADGSWSRHVFTDVSARVGSLHAVELRFVDARTRSRPRGARPRRSRRRGLCRPRAAGAGSLGHTVGRRGTDGRQLHHGQGVPDAELRMRPLRRSPSAVHERRMRHDVRRRRLLRARRAGHQKSPSLT